MSKKVEAEMPLHIVEKWVRHSRKLCGRVFDKILAPNFESENEWLLQFALVAVKIEKMSPAPNKNLFSETVSDILRKGLFHFNEKVVNLDFRACMKLL